MRLFITALATLLAVVLVTAQGQINSVTLESARTSYQKATEKVVTTYIAGLADLQSEYQKQLSALDETLRKKGDLEAILVVRKEKDRFVQTKTMPEAAIVQSPAELKALQQKYSKSAESLEDSKSKGLAALSGPYLQTLEDLKKSLTQSGKIDEALATKEEIAKIKAETTAKTANVASSPEALPVPTPKASKETIVCSRCRGTGFSSEECEACKGTGRCSTCNGTGKKPVDGGLLGGTTRKVKRLGEGAFPCSVCKSSGKCKECNGTGHSTSSIECYACNGKGQIQLHKYAKNRTSEPETRTESITGKTATERTGVVESKLTPVQPTAPAKPKVELQFTDFKKTVEGLRTALADGKAKDIDFNKAVASPEENKATLFKSKVYIFEASPRQINVGASKDDRFSGGVGIKPDSHEVGQKTVSLFWELKRDDLVTVTYGIVGKDNIIYFDLAK